MEGDWNFCNQKDLLEIIEYSMEKRSQQPNSLAGRRDAITFGNYNKMLTRCGMMPMTRSFTCMDFHHGLLKMHERNDKRRSLKRSRTTDFGIWKNAEEVEKKEERDTVEKSSIYEILMLFNINRSFTTRNQNLCIVEDHTQSTSTTKSSSSSESSFDISSDLYEEDSSDLFIVTPLSSFSFSESEASFETFPSSDSFSDMSTLSEGEIPSPRKLKKLINFEYLRDVNDDSDDEEIPAAGKLRRFDKMEDLRFIGVDIDEEIDELTSVWSGSENEEINYRFDFSFNEEEFNSDEFLSSTIAEEESLADSGSDESLNLEILFQEQGQEEQTENIFKRIRKVICSAFKKLRCH